MIFMFLHVLHGHKIPLIADAKISGMGNVSPEYTNGWIIVSENFQIRYYWGVMFYKTIENNAYQINFRVKNIIEKYGKNYFKEAL